MFEHSRVKIWYLICTIISLPKWGYVLETLIFAVMSSQQPLLKEWKAISISKKNDIMYSFWEDNLVDRFPSFGLGDELWN